MNFLYIFILIIIILFIHGLIFKMKNNQIIYTIENFKQSNNQIKKKMSGSWTSDTSNIINIDSNNYLVTNLINIDIFNDTIIFKDQVLFIKNISDKLLYAENENLKINIYFDNKYINKPIFGQSLKVASLYDFTNKKAYYIFKLNNNGKLPEKVKYIIKNKLIQLDQIGLSYSKNNLFSIKSFNYDENNLYFKYVDYNNQNEVNQKFLEMVENKYLNEMRFRIFNVFRFSENRYQFSNLSQVITLEFMKNNEVPTSLVYNLNDELKNNNLEENFNFIITYILIDKNVGKSSSKPTFDSITINSQDELKLKNNINNYYNPKISIPDLNSVSQDVFLKYDLQLLYFVFTVNNVPKDNMTNLKTKNQINTNDKKQINIPIKMIKDRLLNNYLIF
jgi:hypothetical protein